MSDTNLNLYKIFCVVAESKNYKEASDKLYLTESTISSHITNLEKKLDIILFYRERDGLVLTEAGKELYDSMHNNIKDLEFAENAIIQNYDISKAKISIGCPSHISIFYLSKYITKVRNDYPNLKIDIVSVADYNGLLQLLQRHIVDFVIIDTVPDNINNELIIKTLKKINNIFISNELIEIKDIKEMEQYKYILNYKESISTQRLFEVLKENNVEIEADIQSDNTEMRIEEVRQGQGIGYVMKEAVEDALNKGELYEIKLPIKLPEVNINLIYIEKYLTKMDKIFIKKYLEI